MVSIDTKWRSNSRIWLFNRGHFRVPPFMSFLYFQVDPTSLLLANFWMRLKHWELQFQQKKIKKLKNIFFVFVFYFWVSTPTHETSPQNVSKSFQFLLFWGFSELIILSKVFACRIPIADTWLSAVQIKPIQIVNHMFNSFISRLFYLPLLNYLYLKENLSVFYNLI